MSQHDLDIANQGFPATRADLNNALQALGSTNSGATAPSTTYANQLWYDTANNILKIRNEDNDAWISVLYLDQTNDAVTQFDVDNIRIDGNTISSTDTNGDITLDPNGTGDTTVNGRAVITGASTTTYDATAVGGQATAGTLKIQNTDNSADVFAAIDFNTNNDRVVNRIVSGHGNTTGNGFLAFVTENSGTPAEGVRIVSSGDVGIGRNNPEAIVGSHGGGLVVQSASGRAFTTSHVAFQDTSGNNNFLQLHNGETTFSIGGTAALKIDTNRDVMIGKTTSSFSTQGFFFNVSPGQLDITCNQNNPLRLNRVNNDGVLTSYQQDGSEEGTVSVSGGTVSYNGGHLSRWSRLLDGSKPTTILKGTVMSNLNDMIVWSHDATDAVLDDDGNEIEPARDAYTEDNEQLNHTKVSDTEGDADVAGVFVAWDDRDDFNDFFLAMTGDFIIRIANGTTVARGDLLMSAGDGTAKPQGDDIVRSKTIAKVTSATVSHTYDDGSYLVPCVLMAC